MRRPDDPPPPPLDAQLHGTDPLDGIYPWVDGGGTVHGAPPPPPPPPREPPPPFEDEYAPAAARFLAAMFEGMGDTVETDIQADRANIHQIGLRIVRGLEGEARADLLSCWTALHRCPGGDSGTGAPLGETGRQKDNRQNATQTHTHFSCSSSPHLLD